MAGIALFLLLLLAVTARAPALRTAYRPRHRAAPVWLRRPRYCCSPASVGLAWHYFPRHRYLFGEKYDSVMIDKKDLARIRLSGHPARRQATR